MCSHEGLEMVPKPPSEHLPREVVSSPLTRWQGANELPANLGAGGGELSSLPRDHPRSNHGHGVPAPTTVGGEKLL